MYRFLDEVEADTVWILALVHTARQWPPMRDWSDQGAYGGRGYLWLRVATSR